MSLFLFTYFSIYGLMHYYAFGKARRAFDFSGKTSVFSGLFMLAMILAPIAVLLAEREGIPIGARFWAYLSFTWMGLLFLFVTISAAVDFGRFLLFIGSKALKKTIPPIVVLPRKLFFIGAALTLAIHGYGLFDAGQIQRERYIVTSPKISRQTKRLRIAQISDVHLGLLVKTARLHKILAEVEAAQPDLLISTGDLVDGQLNDLTEEEKLFAAIQPPLGKIAITGNHEFYAGLKDSLDFIQKAGFRILRNERLLVNGIVFVGLDDPAGGYTGQGALKAAGTLFAARPRRDFTILLKHRPSVDPASLGHFDLQLSGHTHKGQIFPFNLISWLFYPYRAGHLTKLDPGYLYLSRGSGTWGPPIRFLAPPEVTVIDLVHGDFPSVEKADEK